jgi:hypothetical protein
MNTVIKLALAAATALAGLALVAHGARSRRIVCPTGWHLEGDASADLLLLVRVQPASVRIRPRTTACVRPGSASSRVRIRTTAGRPGLGHRRSDVVGGSNHRGHDCSPSLRLQGDGDDDHPQDCARRHERLSPGAARMRYLALALLSTAASAEPMPYIKGTAQCSGDYVQSGNYCAPKNDRARTAVPKVGSCPSVCWPA